MLVFEGQGGTSVDNLDSQEQQNERKDIRTSEEKDDVLVTDDEVLVCELPKEDPIRGCSLCATALDGNVAPHCFERQSCDMALVDIQPGIFRTMMNYVPNLPILQSL